MNRSFESILTREFLQQTYYDEKKFQAEIADIVGCSTATVRHYMRKYNMKGDRTRGHPKQGPGRRGPASNRWKGGRVVEKSGYIKVYVGHKDGRTRYRREHMLVWEAANGPIPKGWEIHHVNGVKTDNRLENLQALPPEKHAKVISELRKRIYQLIQENDELRAKIERLSK